MKSFLKSNFLLVLVILVAALLRFYKLSTIPVGFNDDEAAFGYNAYSILKYGFDEWGRYFPFPTFESFGDWKLVFYLYLTVVSQFIFGLSEFATRFPSALFGVFTTVATYFLAKELFDKRVGIVAALFVTISPWQIVASRNAFESDLLSFFITLGAYFFVKATKDIKYLIFSSVAFAICFYVYRSAWFFIPLFLSSQFYFFKKTLLKDKKTIFVNIAIAFVLLLPLLPVVLTFRGQSRFVQESFITGVQRIGITNEVNERRGYCTQNLPGMLCSVIYNKYLFFISSYISNYTKNISYETFFQNSSPTGFQSFMKRSAFHLFELPLIIAGLIFAVKTKSSAAKVLIPWILLAPVGAAITGIGNYGRINLMMSAPQILSAFGLLSLINLAAKYRLQIPAMSAAALIIIFSTAKMTVDILYVEPPNTSRYQRYGYKELFSYLQQQTAYDHYIISRKIDNSHQYIQYLYFQKIDPKFLQENIKRSRGRDGWVQMESIGKYTFAPSLPGVENIPPKTLLVSGQKEVTFPLGPIFTIYYLNGDPGFLIYDIDKVREKIQEIEREK